jgi:hypothetical protein
VCRFHHLQHKAIRPKLRLLVRIGFALRIRFLAILGGQYPTWREARAELNELPLAAKAWNDVV